MRYPGSRQAGSREKVEIGSPFRYACERNGGEELEQRVSGEEIQAATFLLLDMLMKTAVRKDRKRNHGIPYESIESPWITTRLPQDPHTDRLSPRFTSCQVDQSKQA